MRASLSLGPRQHPARGPRLGLRREQAAWRRDHNSRRAPRLDLWLEQAAWRLDQSKWRAPPSLGPRQHPARGPRLGPRREQTAWGLSVDTAGGLAKWTAAASGARSAAWSPAGTGGVEARSKLTAGSATWSPAGTGGVEARSKQTAASPVAWASLNAGAWGLSLHTTGWQAATGSTPPPATSRAQVSGGQGCIEKCEGARGWLGLPKRHLLSDVSAA